MRACGTADAKAVLTTRKRRLLLLIGALVVALPAAGCLYQALATARDARRFPPPGVFVDVGGRRLHLVCLGAGAPTVVFESASFTNSVSFQVARTALAAHVRVCSYDRVGMGWSDPGPWRMTTGMLADDLKRLQDAAALAPPFVIVASSIGGLTAEMFARRYPERVAGLVFADAATSEMFDVIAPRADSLTTMLGPACVAATTAARLGVIRLADPMEIHPSTSDGAARSAALLYQTKAWSAYCSLVRGLPDSQHEFAAAPPLRHDVPVVVLLAERFEEGLLPPVLARRLGGDLLQLRDEVRAKRPQLLARRLSRVVARTVPDSGHLIGSSRPQAVVDAVLEVLSAGTP